MKRFIVFLLVVAIGFLGYLYFTKTGVFEKRKSPKKVVVFTVDDLDLKVLYNRPSKRNRDVFGALVPFNEVWRTGANEATTFKTNKALKIGNDSLPKGKYTLWTIPSDSTWQIMFNSKQYKWGVDATMKPMYISDFDVVTYTAKVQKLDKPVEQFTIAFDNSTDNLSLTLAWDLAKIVVPLK